MWSRLLPGLAARLSPQRRRSDAQAVRCHAPAHERCRRYAQFARAFGDDCEKGRTVFHGRPLFNVRVELVFRVALFPAVFSKMVATNGTVMTTASRGA